MGVSFMTLGERLQKLRKSKGLSQEQLAQILQVSRQTISKWESDVNNPELEKLKEISEFFEITMDELLGLERSNLCKETLKEPCIDEKTTHKIRMHDAVLMGIILCVLLLSCFMYQKLSTRINDMQSTLQNIIANQGNPVYVQQPVNYGFLEDVHIAYVDIDVKQNTATQVLTFSLRTQKEGAKLWGEYHIGNQIEKVAAVQTASLTYEIRKPLEMRDDITLMIIYEDGDETKSDSVSLEPGIRSKAIGYIEYQEEGGLQWGTSTTPSGEQLNVSIHSNAFINLANDGYAYTPTGLYLDIYNNKERIERKEIPWEEGQSFDPYSYYQYINIEWEKALADGDEITMHLCLEDADGVNITSKDFLHLIYSKERGIEQHTDVSY